MESEIFNILLTAGITGAVSTWATVNRLTVKIDYLTKILIGYEFIGKRRPAPPNWQNNVIFG